MSIDTGTWITLSIVPMQGFTNVYRDLDAPGGLIARPAPAVLLQADADGQRRQVFAVVRGAELVPADSVDGHVAAWGTSTWEVWYSRNVGMIVHGERCPTGGPRD